MTTCTNGRRTTTIPLRSCGQSARPQSHGRIVDPATNAPKASARRCSYLRESCRHTDIANSRNRPSKARASSAGILPKIRAIPSSAALTPTNRSARARRRRSRIPSGSTTATIRSMTAVNRRPVRPVPPCIGGAEIFSRSCRSTSSINSSSTLAVAESINPTRYKSSSPRAIAARVRWSRVFSEKPRPINFPAAARPMVNAAPSSASASSCAVDDHAPASECSALRRSKNSAMAASFRSTSIDSRACSSAMRSIRAQSDSAPNSCAAVFELPTPSSNIPPQYSKLCSNLYRFRKSVRRIPFDRKLLRSNPCGHFLFQRRIPLLNQSVDNAGDFGRVDGAVGPTRQYPMDWTTFVEDSELHVERKRIDVS